MKKNKIFKHSFSKKSLMISLFSVTLTFSPIGLTQQNTAGIENVLLIVADDLGVDNVTVYNEHSQSAFTPTIDQLANEGVLFRNAWANPSCAPTRGSLMTGRHAFRNGVTHPSGGQNVLDPDEVTVAEVLSEAGYQTALFGKWHLGNGRGANTGTLPTDQGFDYFSGHINGNIVDYFAWPKATLTEPGQNVADNEITETEYATQVNTQEAVEWINATTNPWLAVVSYAAPHSPFHVPPSDRYSNINLNGEVGDICGAQNRDSDDDCYRAMTETMDSYVSDLLTQIDPVKLANTLIIFMGDNGTPTQTTIEEGIFRTDHAKGTAFQGGVRVPFIVAGGPDVDIRNTEMADLIHVTDVFSTIIDIAGAQQPTNTVIDGESFLSNITPGTNGRNTREFQFAESINGNTDQWAISNGTTKFISDTANGNRNTGGCYDLIADPGELDPNSGDQSICNALESNSPRNVEVPVPTPLPTPAPTPVVPTPVPTPAPVPVQVEAEDYDAYVDTDIRNIGGQYREDGVDIQSTSDIGGGFNVGWIRDGEWLEYTVSLQAGTYDLIARLASRRGGGEFDVRVGEQTLEPASVDSTGDWQSWVNQDLGSVEIPTQGNYTIRVNISSGSFNLNWLRFDPQL